MNERIEINPLICHGNPVIKNTRVLVANILADLAAGRTAEQIIKDYPQISLDDISAALNFSSEVMTFAS